MAAKPIKMLELHYTMIQFLINYDTLCFEAIVSPGVVFYQDIHFVCVWCLVFLFEHALTSIGMAPQVFQLFYCHVGYCDETIEIFFVILLYF